MAAPTTPRTVTDATRFTAQVPHATVKPNASGRRKIPASRRSPASIPSGGLPGGSGGGRFRTETPEERVARLRAAHLAAKDAELSSFDKLVARARPWMDSAHRITVLGLMGFTCVAAVVTVYTAIDMLRYNRNRKNDFFALSKIAETDHMLAARLAYVRGDATEEQTRMVEELQATAQKQGVKLPPLFQDDGVTPRMTPEEARDLDAQAQLVAPLEGAEAAGKGTKRAWSWKDWALGNLKREEEGEDYGTSEARLGYESLSEEDDGVGVRDSDLVRALEDKKEWAKTKVQVGGDTIKEKAKEAFREEKERQAKGGPLDRLGVDEKKASEGEGKKNGWW